MSYVNPKLRYYFESLSIDLKNEILSRNVHNFLRVTIGSEEDMETFCATLTEFVENVL